MEFTANAISRVMMLLRHQDGSIDSIGSYAESIVLLRCQTTL
jgi:hypothetical protein